MIVHECSWLHVNPNGVLLVYMFEESVYLSYLVSGLAN